MNYMKDSILRVLGFCGACIAFYIGAGYATMQEIMQYEASYGIRFWIVIAVAGLIYLYTNWSFATNGAKANLQRGGDIYRVYCGKYIGMFFDYFATFFCYMCFIVMCGGANSVLMEQWGLPNGVGSVVLTIAVMATIYFGLDGLVNALKRVAPLIILMIIFVAVYSLIAIEGDVTAGIETIDSGKYAIKQVGNGNSIASGASYGGFVIFWFAAFLAELGAKHNAKEVNCGMYLSILGIFGVSIICCLALMANIDNLWNVDVPALVLARQIHPAVAIAYAVIVFMGIYSSACPLLWTGLRRVAEEKTKRYKILTVVLGVVGCLVASFVPFKGLVNVIYGANGYLGLVLVVFMIVHDIRIFILKRKDNK